MDLDAREKLCTTKMKGSCVAVERSKERWDDRGGVRPEDRRGGGCVWEEEGMLLIMVRI